MLKFFSLSSGSCGNCYYLTDGRKGIIIDAGVSLRRLKKMLCEKGFGLDSFQAVLVTHDHMDHVRHLGAWCKNLRKPVFATGLLHDVFSRHPMIRDWIASCRRELSEGANRIFPDEEDSPLVTYFLVPHDASQTVGYFIEWQGSRFFLMTDAGRMTGGALEYASAADTLVIESNYDPEMLIGGPYTHDLKMRICNGSGHLSNDECAEAIGKVWHPGLRNIFLCHLSENNNTPSLAFSASSRALEAIDCGGGRSAKDVTNLQTLPRTSPSALFTI